MIGLSFVLLAVWTDVCEADPSKGEGTGEDTFATKKEVEETKKEVEETKKKVEEQKKEVEEQQKSALATLRQELRELKEEVSKEKVANTKLRRADADILKVEKEMREIDKEEEKQHAALRKRQHDVVDETKKLIRAEINSGATKSIIRAEINSEATKSIMRAEIDAHKNCQSGSDSWTPNIGDVARSKSTTVNFNPAFSRKPSVIASLSYVQKYQGGTRFYFQIVVNDVSPTKMTLTHAGYGMYDQFVYWLACQ